MNKTAKTILKSIIKASCVEAVNGIVTYTQPILGKSLSKSLAHIGGISIGYYVGDVVAEKIVEDVDKAYDAYIEKEDIIDV